MMLLLVDIVAQKFLGINPFRRILLSVGAAQEALATNETAIISEMSKATGETFSTTEEAINRLVGLMLGRTEWN